MRFFLVVSTDVEDRDRVVIGNRSSQNADGIVLDGFGGVRASWDALIELTYEEYGKLKADLLFGNEGEIDRYRKMYADGEIACARYEGDAEREYEGDVDEDEDDRN